MIAPAADNVVELRAANELDARLLRRQIEAASWRSGRGVEIEQDGLDLTVTYEELPAPIRRARSRAKHEALTS